MSLERLREHRDIWEAKPELASVYGVWFQDLVGHIGPAQRVLEVGAGPGLLSEWARARRPDIRWIATDLLAAPWNDVAADASALPLRAGSVDLVVGVDVLHHLSRPRGFFTEAARVITPGGRIALLEPWVTPFSYPIYRFVHQEGCTLGIDPWEPFGTGGKDAFDGDGALPWRIVRSTPEAEWRSLGVAPPRVTTFNGFAYLFTLGFRRASLLPRPAEVALMGLDRILRPLGTLTAMRALLVWDRLA